jgi:hypothetical protein
MFVPITGDKAPCTEPVYVQYMVIPCPEYQHFPEPEHTEFFQDILEKKNNYIDSVYYGCAKNTPTQYIVIT